MSPTVSTRISFVGRVCGEPHACHESDGSVAGFVAGVEQVVGLAGRPMRPSYRVVCSGQWTELVRRYLRNGGPVFVAGEVVTPACAGAAARSRAAWLIASEVIPLGPSSGLVGLAPAASIKCEAISGHEVAA